MTEHESRDKSRNSSLKAKQDTVNRHNQLDLKGFSVFELFDQLAEHYDPRINKVRGKQTYTQL